MERMTGERVLRSSAFRSCDTWVLCDWDVTTINGFASSIKCTWNCIILRWNVMTSDVIVYTMYTHSPHTRTPSTSKPSEVPEMHTLHDTINCCVINVTAVHKVRSCRYHFHVCRDTPMCIRRWVAGSANTQKCRRKLITFAAQTIK